MLASSVNETVPFFDEKPSRFTLGFTGYKHGLLFDGPINNGKWNAEEKKYCEELIEDFLKGACPQCNKGIEIISS